MKKSLLLLGAGLLAFASLSAQKSRVFVADEDLSSTWFNAGITATAEAVTCGEEGVYGLYTISEKGDGSLLNRNWWYDFGFVFTAEEWAAVNNTLHLSMWVNALDGINAGDSVQLIFAITSTVDDVSRERGWPEHWIVTPANEWVWVSFDFTEKGFEDNATVKEMSGETTFKMAPHPIGDIYDLNTKAYKMAYQNITLSAGPVAKPDYDPCGVCVKEGGCGTNVASVANAKSSLFFPNPANGSINLNKLSSGQIFDISGKAVATFNNATSVDISSISQGIYFVKAGNQVEKLIVK